ncbi:MAG: EAL domain-containing protein, partial [Thiomicrorhabdus sp.]|nr:EAL domain-containing protein [Thiomicrorhabdus sp.]
MSEVFIGRQPVLDAYMNVFAYDLQFYQGLTPTCDATLHATHALITKIQEAIGFQSIVGNHTAMVHLPSQMIRKEFLPRFDALHPMILEISNGVLGSAHVLRSLKELKQLGSSIVLGEFIDAKTSAKLASISDYVKIDVKGKDGLELKAMIDGLHQQGIKVIAQKVDTDAQFQFLKTLGFDYFQGYFFNNPTVINGKKLSGNRLILLQILAKVNEPSTRFQELSDLIGQDVTLSYKLLEAINNPAAMVPIRVESISDALRYLGL